MLKKISTIGYVTALATSPTWLSGCSLTPAEEKPTALFSLTSDSMHFENPSASKVTLVMEGVDPEAIWFTDRPVRESGVMSTSQLAAEWNDGESFRADPPNAALVLHEPIKVNGKTTETLVVEILDADYDAKKHSLRADLKVLTMEDAGNVTGHLSAHGSRHDTAWPEKAGAVSLFIDSITLCTTPATCNKNSTSNYTANSTIYFQSSITSTDN